MKRVWLLIVLTIALMSMSGAVQAQRGGRGGEGDRTPIAPQPVGTPVREPIAFTPPQNLPSQADIQALIAELPSQTDVQAIVDNLELPYSLDALSLPETSPEAYAALVHFGQSYLGTTINPLFAGTIDGQLPDNPERLSELPIEIETISTELPAEIQTLMTTVTGVAYWGITENGAAALYTASDCAMASCSMTVDNMQVTLNNGSLGMYSIYLTAQVNDALTAQNVISSIYPNLAAYTMTPYTVEEGYAFTGYNAQVSAEFTASGFITGVNSSENGQIIVYVVYGLGDAYLELLR